MKRSSGVLLSISSLPSKYGIGTLGKSAYDFADFLNSAGQKYWQLLPLGPTSYGDSPYASFSTYAGNPYFIDLDQLVEDGLLSIEEIESERWGDDPRNVDYGQMYISRWNVLSKAKAKGWSRDAKKVSAFVADNDWVENYALFMAVKKHFGDVSWLDWPEDDIRLHKPEAVEKYTKLLRDDMDLYIYVQYLFFEQWTKLKNYINDYGIEIIGDIPIYVAMDSADVWANASQFKLNTDNIPVVVSGVPPDYFSEDGQLWGNPIYDWDVMKKDGYKWWLNRIAGVSKMFDVIRIDHFRGFDTYWSVPYGEKTAKKGQWCKGPGMDLVGLLREEFANIEFIAEDLGEPAESVVKLLKDSGFPGMKVLQFGFDSGEPSNYQPHTFTNHCICYTGTHDNSPVLLWRDEAKNRDVEYACEYLGIEGKEDFNWGMIRGGMRSVADLFVCQMQDYLGLGEGHRMNVPGTSSGNWTWRMLEDELSDNLAKRIYKMTKMYERLK